MERVEDAVRRILAEDAKRRTAIAAEFNPISGLNSPAFGKRVRFRCKGLKPDVMWLPETMMKDPFVAELAKHKAVTKFVSTYIGKEPTEELVDYTRRMFLRVRIKYDFAFWCAYVTRIKAKGGTEAPFILNRPQRRFVDMLEAERENGRPIRIVMLKARQWGGSTLSQLYMSWLQLTQAKGLNSLIIAHEQKTSYVIKGMFDRMIAQYPRELLYGHREQYDANAPKIRGVGRTGLAFRVDARDCEITIGTYENPDSCRGGDYSLVHCSEVGLWRATDTKTPEDVVGSACTGVKLQANTMVVYESTAKGSDNFFHREYLAAKNGESQFKAFFVPWWEVDWDVLEPENIEAFARQLWEKRNETESDSVRRDSGQYNWRLWQKGATLSAINWYIEERRGKSSHDIMASECPSDDIEAFVYSGANVFDMTQIEMLREKDCRVPVKIGDIVGAALTGEDALKDVGFVEDSQGRLKIWDLPEVDEKERIDHRYLVVVDPGRGRSDKADYSVICVIDRIDMMDGGRPMVVAQWHGRVDMDVLAWKAAQIAKWYDDALLVIESNSYESANSGAGVYVLAQIKDYYDNIYARKQSPEEINEGLPRKYGFHTNTLTKPMLILGLQQAVRGGLWRERCEECLEEFLTYVQHPNGSYAAAPKRHDDMLMTRAIGLHICFNEMEMPKAVSRGGLGGKFHIRTNGGIARRVGCE